MKRENRKNWLLAVCLLAAFAVWTWLVTVVDVQMIGPQGSAVGFGTMAGNEGTVTFGFMPVLKDPLSLENGGTGSKSQPGAWERIVATAAPLTPISKA